MQMSRAEDLTEWFMNRKEEFGLEELMKRFKMTPEEWEDIKKILLEKGMALEAPNGKLLISEKVTIFTEKFKNELPELLRTKLKITENLQNTELPEVTDWAHIHEIDQFLIYPGEEKIYEIKIKGKTLKIEGKDIADYNIFILRFFEEFGVMLPKYKGVANDWSKLVTHWHKTYGRIAKDLSEHLSVGLEAKEAVIDYINNCVVSDDYIVKDGMITFKNGCLYVPTRIIKKFLKRAEIFITMRKLGYEMRDLLLSGSLPLKIENKSERFWRLDPKKFDLKLESGLHIEKDKDQTSPEESEPVPEKAEGATQETAPETAKEKAMQEAPEKKMKTEEEEEEEGGYDDA